MLRPDGSVGIIACFLIQYGQARQDILGGRDVPHRSPLVPVTDTALAIDEQYQRQAPQFQPIYFLLVERGDPVLGVSQSRERILLT